MVLVSFGSGQLAVCYFLIFTVYESPIFLLFVDDIVGWSDGGEGGHGGAGPRSD